MAAEIGHSYEFENFRLDPREKILFRDNKPLSLTPKVFETLQIFVEHPGHLLPKDVLIQKLWQDRFVAESNLTFNIKIGGSERQNANQINSLRFIVALTCFAQFFAAEEYR